MSSSNNYNNFLAAKALWRSFCERVSSRLRFHCSIVARKQDVKGGKGAGLAPHNRVTSLYSRGRFEWVAWAFGADERRLRLRNPGPQALLSIFV